MSYNSLSPICLFTYNRLDETKKTITALKNNFLAQDSDLHIFSDAAKASSSDDKVNKVREYLRSVSGFKSITIIEATVNKGLANSIIDGVTSLLKLHDKVIVVEDDLITANNFLNFMNDTLAYYEGNDDVFSVSGYVPMIEMSKEDSDDVFVYGRAHSWGWGTWKDRWNTVDWNVPDWNELKKSPSQQKAFNKYGGDLFKMLSDFKNGKNNSWYVRFTYSQQKQQKFTVYPYTTKVVNIGFNNTATHCDAYNRTNLDIDLSGKTTFFFPNAIIRKAYVEKQMLRYKSFQFRLFSKLLTYLLKMKIIKQRIYKYGN